MGLVTNPVLANAMAGLATSAVGFAAVERTLLYQMRNKTVDPFGETVQQVFARISAFRDSLDGPQVSLHLPVTVLSTATVPGTQQAATDIHRHVSSTVLTVESLACSLRSIVATVVDACGLK